MNRPEPNEYAPYYGNYVSQVAESADVLEVLDSQASDLRSMFEGLPEEKGSFTYADGKWTIKEVLSHLIDGERMFAYRVLRISRGDETPIEGFEQNDYIETSNANKRPFASLLDEFDLQRRSNLILLNNLSDEASRRMGTASGLPISTRAMTYIMAGHVLHHAAVLKERYSV
ncbi:MAG: DinB family protein [Pyrinomonadaceae bacterium]